MKKIKPLLKYQCLKKSIKVKERKTAGLIVGEKRSASSKEQSVPEWILTPDGNDLRYYTMRAPNNSGTTVDINNAIFFYDTHAS